MLAATEYVVDFTVIDELGAAVVGAQIGVSGAGKDAAGITDGAGQYAVSLPDGSYAYTVYLDGYRQYGGTLHVSGGTASVPAVTLSRIYNIRFIVTDGFSAVAGATVTADGVSMETGHDGVAVLPLSRGVYTYTVQKAGLNTGGGTVNVVGDADQHVTLTGGVSVVFAALNEYAAPIAGALITVDGATVATGSDGTVTVWMTPGSHYYSASHPYYNGIAASFTVPEMGPYGVNVNMSYLRYDADFVVKNTIGQPVVNAVLETDGITATTDVNGFARLGGLLPGNHDVRIGGPEYYDSIFAISITDAPVSADVVIVKKDLGTVTWEADSTAQTQSRYVRPSYSSSTSSSTSSSSTVKTDDAKEEQETDEPDETETADEVEEPQKEEQSVSPSPSPSATPEPTQEAGEDEESNSVVNIGLNIANLDGTPGVDLFVEMHSDVISAYTDKGGYAYLKGVEPGEHTLYIKDEQGNELAQKDLTITRGAETQLDLTNIGGDILYIGLGIESVTVDGLLDGGVLVFTGMIEGENPAEVTGDTGTTGGGIAGETNLFWMLIISVTAVAVAVIILLIAIRKMKKSSGAKKQDQPTQGIDIMK